jgi:VWFA-related protein
MPTVAQQGGETAPSQEGGPVDSGAREEIQVRMVQVDVSVIDPKGDSFRSVPDLTADHFDIRLDGEPLTEAQRRQLRLDHICDETVVEMPSRTVDDLPLGVRPIVALIDFNYLDAAGRHKVAAAIDSLAETPGERGETYKIYGLTQQLRMMTDGFTRDAEQLRAVAEEVRRTAWRERPAEAGRTDEVARESVEPELDQEARRIAGLGPRRESGAPLELSDLLGQGSVFGRIGGADVLQIEASSEISAIFDNFTPYNAIASVGALEAVMRAHTYIPGRKIIVLFTTESFRIPDESRMRKNIDGVRALARQGFAIWTVEVEGISVRQSGRSELISALAQDTGGHSVRKTGRLERAFQGARQQMSCYYLFSVPVPTGVEGTDRMLLSVGLDTDAHPDLWGLRVIAPTQVTVPDREQELENRRVAALLSPDDFDSPPVDVLLDYPVTMDGREVLPVRLRVPLDRLNWERTRPNGPYTARVLVDAVAERQTSRGRQPFCSIGSEKVGTLELRLPAPPAEGSAGLAVELPCPLDERGLLTARGAITDLSRSAAGAGRSSVYVGEVHGSETWQVIEPRVEAASGRDFWWYPGAESAVKDRARRAWRPIAAPDGEDVSEADPGDRLALSYVLCGPDRAAVGEAISHALTRRRPDGSIEVFQAFGGGALDLGKPTEGAFCAAARLTVPEYTLMPGGYAFVVHRRDAPAEAITADEAGDAIFARLPFEIR